MWLCTCWYCISSAFQVFKRKPSPDSLQSFVDLGVQVEVCPGHAAHASAGEEKTWRPCVGVCQHMPSMGLGLSPDPACFHEHLWMCFCIYQKNGCQCTVIKGEMVTCDWSAVSQRNKKTFPSFLENVRYFVSFWVYSLHDMRGEQEKSLQNQTRHLTENNKPSFSVFPQSQQMKTLQNL